MALLNTNQYNWDGLRTRKTVEKNGAATVTEYVRANERLLGVKTGEDTLRLLYQGDSCIGFVRNNTDVYLYVKDFQSKVAETAGKPGENMVNYTCNTQEAHSRRLKMIAVRQGPVWFEGWHRGRKRQLGNGEKGIPAAVLDFYLLSRGKINLGGFASERN